MNTIHACTLYNPLLHLNSSAQIPFDLSVVVSNYTVTTSSPSIKCFRNSHYSTICGGSRSTEAHDLIGLHGFRSNIELTSSMDPSPLPSPSPSQLSSALPTSASLPIPTSESTVMPTSSPTSAWLHHDYFYMANGPSKKTLPRTYTCQQACALLFGGNASDWGGSISSITLTHTCYYVRL